ncbi:hypothetical protein IQ268_08935 [Oculatella sp. LEGE 06141]|uniref:hypothetical protein n=1 Tax=Oculatella sp. LEGE 06141 TaxID=1828648 RepID=UPI00187F790A|nr:hypothetical protein [Oculatella sp. LEGE 06141]MBE9178683.1 hypothetical protein [Oculatella sp. LEGE 06141]
MGRKKLDRREFKANVAPETPDRLHAIARSVGLKYGEGGNIGGLLDLIAKRGQVSDLAGKSFLIVPLDIETSE